MNPSFSSLFFFSLAAVNDAHDGKAPNSAEIVLLCGFSSCRKHHVVLLLLQKKQHHMMLSTRRKTTQENYLRAVGCLAVVRIVHRRQRKEEERGEAGVHLGYDEDRRACRIWVIERNQIVTSRDVEFDEAK